MHELDSASVVEHGSDERPSKFVISFEEGTIEKGDVMIA